MIIACPACTTRYVVPDSAVGAEGRTVRCAKCRHSWFQEPPELDLATGPAESSPAEAQFAVEPHPSPVDERPRFVVPEDLPEPQADQQAVRDDDWRPPPVPESEIVAPPAYETPPGVYAETAGDESQFDASPPFRRRRGALRLLTWAAVIFALLVAALVAAVSYWGLPDWVPINRPTFAMAPSQLQLDFPAEEQERRQLPNGTEYFGASGSITNTGAVTQTVPPILIVLRDARDRIVYSWELQPPKRSLAPGETVSVNEAVTDVPRSAKFAEIGWKPG